MLSNRARLLPHGGPAGGVWLCGTDSQGALWDWSRGEGLDDLDAALARVAVTLAGHTQGGQVRLLGWSPVVPSRFGNRYAHGLVEEDGRRLIVSGGLGCSTLPVRLGVPPEITLVRLSG